MDESIIKQLSELEASLYNLRRSINETTPLSLYLIGIGGETFMFEDLFHSKTFMKLESSQLSTPKEIVKSRCSISNELYVLREIFSSSFWTKYLKESPKKSLYVLSV